MDVSKIPTGKAPPEDINVVVEIPQGSAVKYEVDKASGAIFVDGRRINSCLALAASLDGADIVTRHAHGRTRPARWPAQARTTPGSVSV